ncbi:hypothetical protein ACFL4X_00550 [Gemmatimonadota bacterium]
MKYYYLVLLAGVVGLGVWIASCGRAPQTETGQAQGSDPAVPMHCQLIRAGEIEAIVGDGSGLRTRPGLWTMSSIKHHFSIFKNMSSGMLTGEFRGKADTKLEYVDDSTSVLKREPTDDYPVKATMVIRARSPYYLDTELTIRDAIDLSTDKNLLGENPFLGDERQVSYNCYVNSPDDTRIHFLSGGQWERFIPSVHSGPGSSIAPAYLNDSELEVWPESDDPRFHWYQRYEKRFDRPFYYGRFGKMVLILVFDKPRWLRFYISPTGAGASLIPGQQSPAWDFEWLIPRKDYRPNQDYLFRTCLVYKQFESDEDVIREVDKVQRDLGYETAKYYGIELAPRRSGQ